MRDWTEITVADGLSTIIDYRGKTPPKSQSGIPLISAKNVKAGRVVFAKPEYISPVDFERWTTRGLTQGGDVLITTEAPAGEVAPHPSKGQYQISRRVMALRADERRLHHGFLLYALQSDPVQQELLSRNRGTTVPRVLKPDITGLKIPRPPLAEQRRIATVLGSLDRKIELNRNMNRTLEEMAQALFKSWFIDFDGHDNLVDGESGPIPSGWEAGTLEAVAVLNPQSWSKKRHPDSVEYVDLRNTDSGRVLDVAHYEWEDAPSRARRVLKPWDTIFGCVRPRNRSFALIHEAGWTGSTGFAVLRGKTAAYATYIYLATTDDSNVARLARLADGAAYPAVRPNVVLETPILVPDHDTLVQFDQVTRPLFRRIALNESESRTLTELRDALLPKLISGELRIPAVVMPE